MYPFGNNGLSGHKSASYFFHRHVKTRPAIIFLNVSPYLPLSPVLVAKLSSIMR